MMDAGAGTSAVQSGPEQGREYPNEEERQRSEDGEYGRGARGTSAPCGPLSLNLDHYSDVHPRVCSGLLLLAESSAYAHQLNEDPWEFSVEWPELRRLGLTCNDGRWLIRRGFVRHAREVTGVDDAKRTFVRVPSLSLSEEVCFVLTDAGRSLSAHIAKSRCDLGGPSGGVCAHYRWCGALPEGVIPGCPSDQVGLPPKPKWDPDQRQLRLAATVVKEFRVPAENQETILAVFEEERWPPKIDDPLRKKSGIDPRRRLHDTINSLNRNQRHRLIRFCADGLGRGVRWTLARDALVAAAQ